MASNSEWLISSDGKFSTDTNISTLRICSSPTDSADLDLHKFAIRNGFRMENRVFPCTCEDYVIEVTDKSRKSEIVEMLVENFLHDETLVKSLRLNACLTTKSELSDLEHDENLLMETVVESGTVLLAIHKSTNRISGALVIMVHKREPKISSKEEEEEEEEEIKRMKKKSEPYDGRLRSHVIKDFYKYIDDIVYGSEDILFSKYPNCKSYAEFELIGINRSDRKKGIASDLYKAGLTVVKEIPEVTLLCGVYTSIYSKKMGEKIGKTPIYKFDVTQLKDKYGNPVFQDTVPNNIVTLMAMEI